MSPTMKLSIVVGLAIISIFYYVWVPPLVQAFEFFEMKPVIIIPIAFVY